MRGNRQAALPRAYIRSALDCDALDLRLRLIGLWQGYAQHAVLKASVDLIFLDVDAERDSALEASISGIRQRAPTSANRI